MKVYGTKATVEVDFNNRTVVTTASQRYPSAVGRLIRRSRWQDAICLRNEERESVPSQRVSLLCRNVAAAGRVLRWDSQRGPTTNSVCGDTARRGGDGPRHRTGVSHCRHGGHTMKILVTGAGGFLGKAIVERLLADGETNLRCMLRDTSKARALEEIASRYPEAKIEFVTVNLRNLAEIARGLGLRDCDSRRGRVEGLTGGDVHGLRGGFAQPVGGGGQRGARRFAWCSSVPSAQWAWQRCDAARWSMRARRSNGTRSSAMSTRIRSCDRSSCSGSTARSMASSWSSCGLA